MHPLCGPVLRGVDAACHVADCGGDLALDRLQSAVVRGQLFPLRPAVLCLVLRIPAQCVAGVKVFLIVSSGDSEDKDINLVGDVSSMNRKQLQGGS